MKLEPFSGWPAAWDGEVQKVLRLAQGLGIPKLRVTVKLGTLRIQEGGRKLVAAVDEADRATQVICPACAQPRNRQQGVQLQVCSACKPDPDVYKNIEWIDGMSRKSWTPLPTRLEKVDEFEFPTFFTVASDYSATGEGRSVDVLMAFAHNANDLRAKVCDQIDSYFSDQADYYPLLVIPEGLEEFLPPRVKKFVKAPQTIRGNFLFYCRCHLNRA